MEVDAGIAQAPSGLVPGSSSVDPVCVCVVKFMAGYFPRECHTKKDWQSAHIGRCESEAPSTQGWLGRARGRPG
eukprot:12920023-Prorocentrum_lima.AAC.1